MPAVVGLAGVLLAACGGGTGAGAAPVPSLASPTSGPGVDRQEVPVDVPAQFGTDELATKHTLTVPRGWSASVYAKVPAARFMAITPDGNLLVSQPGPGTVSLVKPAADGRTGETGMLLTGLRQPHDMVFHTVGGQQYLYLSESNRISRYPWAKGDTPGPQQVLIDNLPDASTPELRGRYAHALKNIALGPDDKLYVAIASTCNVCAGDATSDPERGAIYVYNADGTGRRLFAHGLRNAEGLAFAPDGTSLWAVVNNRDNLPIPATGQVVPSYVDNHPPEEFVHVTDGAFFGWPYCNPTPDSPSRYRKMPVERDHDTNADGHIDCGTVTPVDMGMPAHTAPLGLTFLTGARVPALVRGGAAVPQHGSWNRTAPAGYKVVWFPWQADGRPGDQQDLISGWSTAAATAAAPAWGRPVDAALTPDGALLVSDDKNGVVYRFAGPA
jgi:glucose/arabinose dehydrogenase